MTCLIQSPPEHDTLDPAFQVLSVPPHLACQPHFHHGSSTPVLPNNTSIAPNFCTSLCAVSYSKNIHILLFSISTCTHLPSRLNVFWSETLPSLLVSKLPTCNQCSSHIQMWHLPFYVPHPYTQTLVVFKETPPLAQSPYSFITCYRYNYKWPVHFT